MTPSPPRHDPSSIEQKMSAWLDAEEQQRPMLTARKATVDPFFKGFEVYQTYVNLQQTRQLATLPVDMARSDVRATASSTLSFEKCNELMYNSESSADYDEMDEPENDVHMSEISHRDADERSDRDAEMDEGEEPTTQPEETQEPETQGLEDHEPEDEHDAASQTQPLDALERSSPPLPAAPALQPAQPAQPTQPSQPLEEKQQQGQQASPQVHLESLAQNTPPPPPPPPLGTQALHPPQPSQQPSAQEQAQQQHQPPPPRQPRSFSAPSSSVEKGGEKKAKEKDTCKGKGKESHRHMPSSPSSSPSSSSSSSASSASASWSHMQTRTSRYFTGGMMQPQQLQQAHAEASVQTQTQTQPRTQLQSQAQKSQSRVESHAPPSSAQSNLKRPAPSQAPPPPPPQASHVPLPPAPVSQLLPIQPAMSLQQLRSAQLAPQQQQQQQQAQHQDEQQQEQLSPSPSLTHSSSPVSSQAEGIPEQHIEQDQQQGQQQQVLTAQDLSQRYPLQRFSLARALEAQRASRAAYDNELEGAHAPKLSSMLCPRAQSTLRCVTGIFTSLIATTTDLQLWSLSRHEALAAQSARELEQKAQEVVEQEEQEGESLAPLPVINCESC